MSTRDHKATAKRLLPCKCGWTDANIVDGEHDECCPAFYRPAVAAALAEAVEEQKRLGQLAYDQWQDIRDDLRAENAQLRAEVERLDDLGTDLGLSRIHELYDEINDIKAERDAAEAKGVVLGLKRAAEIARNGNITRWDIERAIAAEIAKAGKP